MLYPKTGELETFWTDYHCEDDSCPGRFSKVLSGRDRQESGWIELGEGSRMRQIPMLDEAG